MAIKTQMETFRTLGKVCELNPQTAVECKFGSEAVNVLSAYASASLSGAEAGNGEVRYFGKALFSLVYEDSEKRVCRAEKGVEFTAKVQDERVYPALTARAGTPHHSSPAGITPSAVVTNSLSSPLMQRTPAAMRVSVPRASSR